MITMIHYDESNMRGYKQSFAKFRILYYKFLASLVYLVLRDQERNTNKMEMGENDKKKLMKKYRK
jgi:hypothetical protein